MAKYLDSNGLSHLIGKIKTALAGKSDTGHTHTDLVNNVSYDSTTKKINQTKGTTTTEVVTLAKVATTGDYDDLTDKPTIPSAGTGSSYPTMDGERALGSNAGYARVDHVHPSDTSRAPTSHASSSDTYGKGTNSNYGHVKLSDATNGTAAASSGGTAATPKAVADAVALIPSAAASTDTPVMDGTAAVGTSTKWAKADHVHPTDTNRAASSHTHGNITNGGDITATAPTIASGDKLIINDESASKITNGPSFGTDTTKYLRNDGTWGAPAGTANQNAFSNVKVGSTTIEADTETDTLELAAGSNITLTPDATNDKVTIAATDTKNTAGSTDSSSKLYLIGATSQDANPQTYSDSAVYEEDGALHASTFNGLDINTSNWGIVLAFDPTGYDETEIAIEAGHTYSLAAACGKGVDLSISSSSTNQNVPTSAAVVNYVASAQAGSATFQGTLVQTDSGSSATKWTQAELEAASYKKGWYWVAEAAGTYANNVMEVGDMLFCVSDKSSAYAAADFTAIQNNIETLTTTEIDTIWAAA